MAERPRSSLNATRRSGGRAHRIISIEELEGTKILRDGRVCLQIEPGCSRLQPVRVLHGPGNELFQPPVAEKGSRRGEPVIQVHPYRAAVTAPGQLLQKIYHLRRAGAGCQGRQDPGDGQQ